MRILSIDYGSITTGLAISDENKLIAMPLVSIVLKKKNSFSELISKIENSLIPYKNEIELIILGDPIETSNNYISSTRKKILDFYEFCKKKLPYQIKLFNEQYTTQTAMEKLKEFGIKHSKIKKSKDVMAATIMLQEYLDSHKDN